MNYTQLFRRFALLAAASILLVPASAKIYKWVDDNGKVHYSDQPPKNQSKKTETVTVPSGASTKAKKSTRKRSVKPATLMSDLLEKHRTKERALWLSAADGHYKDVKQLLRTGADIETLDSGRGSTMTPLLAATRYRHLDTVRLLMESGADMNAEVDNGNRILHLAAVNGMIELVRDLVNKHVEIDPQNIEGQTPLRLAVEQGREEVVAQLLRSKADPNIRDSHGQSPLMFTIQAERNTLFTRLLKAGADPNSRADNGSTVLLWAVTRGDVEVVKSLIAAGADVNARDNAGESPILRASRFGNLPMVSTLLKAGADPGVWSNKGETAARAAVDRGHIDVVARLEGKR